MKENIDKILARWTKYRKVCFFTLAIGLFTNALFVFMECDWWKYRHLCVPISNIVVRAIIAALSIVALVFALIKFNKNIIRARLEMILTIVLFILGTIGIAYCSFIRNGVPDAAIRISNLTPMCIIGVVVIMGLPIFYSHTLLVAFSIVSGVALKTIKYSNISEDFSAQVLFIVALFIISMVYEEQFNYEYTISKKIENMALYDQLTGLYNRNYITEKVLTNDSSVPLAAAVVMLDIDFFKRFNDKYGHQTGDQILKIVSKSLIKSIRKEDIAIRWGGEEMLVLFNNKPRKGEEFNLNSVCERLRKTIERQSL